MTTPYALFRFVPLSECRGLWITYGKPLWHLLPRRRQTFRDLMERRRWREHMVERYVERLIDALAAVTAERDETQRALDGALDNLEHVTAERDKLRAERDALRRELANMTGGL